MSDEQRASAIDRCEMYIAALNGQSDLKVGLNMCKLAMAEAVQAMVNDIHTIAKLEEKIARVDLARKSKAA